MKTLYESILSSTKTGGQYTLEKCKEWLEESSEFKRMITTFNLNYTLEDNKGEIDIALSKPLNPLPNFSIIQSMIQNGKIPFKLGKIYTPNNKMLPIYLSRCELNDFSTLPKYSEEVTVLGGEYKKIDSVPKGCQKINFRFAPSLGGGKGVHVDEIKNIKVKEFTVDSWHDGRSGLVCSCANIKGCQIFQMDVTSSMLDFGYTMTGKRLNKTSQDLLDELDKNNTIGVIRFKPSYEQSRTVETYKCFRKKDGWHLSIEERRRD